MMPFLYSLGLYQYILGSKNIKDQFKNTIIFDYNEIKENIFECTIKILKCLYGEVNEQKLNKAIKNSSLESISNHEKNMVH